MITEKEYLEAQKIVDKYKSEQLNKHAVSGCRFHDNALSGFVKLTK